METHDALDTADLVRRARGGGAGADRAFGVLVARHEGLVFRVVMSVLRDEARALDVAQDTFVRAHRALPTLADDAAFRGWLLRMARRLALNAVRDHAVKRRNEEAAAAIAERLDRRLDAYAERDLVRRTLSRLSDRDRELLHVAYVEQWTHEESAEHYAIGLSALKMRLLRARESFRAVYTEFESPALAA